MNIEAVLLLAEIIAWAVFKVLIEVTCRLEKGNTEDKTGIKVLVAVLDVLTVIALIASPAMCIFDFAVDLIKANRIYDAVEKETTTKVMKLYRIPPYDGNTRIK